MPLHYDQLSDIAEEVLCMGGMVCRDGEQIVWKDGAEQMLCSRCCAGISSACTGNAIVTLVWLS